LVARANCMTSCTTVVTTESLSILHCHQTIEPFMAQWHCSFCLFTHLSLMRQIQVVHGIQDCAKVDFGNCDAGRDGVMEHLPLEYIHACIRLPQTACPSFPRAAFGHRDVERCPYVARRPACRGSWSRHDRRCIVYRRVALRIKRRPGRISAVAATGQHQVIGASGVSAGHFGRGR